MNGSADDSGDGTLDEIVRRAQGGDRDAAARFVRDTQRQVWMLLVHLSDRTVAEDLTQETFERAFGALPRFRGDSSARAWLLSIARRVAADHLRRVARRPRTVAALDDADRATGRHDRPDRQNRSDLGERVALEAAVDALDEERRAAFVLTQMLGLGYAEAAQVCGCPVGTIRSRVARARADLVEALGGHDDLGEAR